MLETIILALIVSKIKGYNILGIFKSWEIYPIIVFEIVYIFIQINIFSKNYEVIAYASMFKSVYICLYIFLIMKYKQYKPAILGSGCIILGGILNDIAIRANGGYMPVFPTLSYLTGYASVDAFEKVNDIHILGNASTNLKFLTDIFDIGYSVLSLGDILIRVFVFLIIYKSIEYLNNTNINYIKNTM